MSRTDHPNRNELLAFVGGARLGRLDEARCYRWLRDQRANDRDLAPQIAARLGAHCDRTARRYIQVLRMPDAIQASYDRGDLTLHRISQIWHLGRAAWAEIAKRISAGEDPAKVADAIVGAEQCARPPIKQHKNPVRALSAIVACIARELPHLEIGDIDRIPLYSSGSPAAATMEGFVKIAQKLLARPREKTSKRQRAA